MTKQKRPSVPARSISKARSRSGNPAVRSGEAEPAVPSTQIAVAIASRRSRAPAPVDERGVLPPDGAAYPQILRGESYVWWRSVLGVVFGLSLFLLVTTVVSQALVTLFWATTAGDQPLPGLFCQGLRVRTADRHAGGQPWPRRIDPDCLGSDGRGPSHAAALAVLGPAADPLALSVRMSGDCRGRSERRDAALHDGWRSHCPSNLRRASGVSLW